jgi:hypothetical protein
MFDNSESMREFGPLQIDYSSVQSKVRHFTPADSDLYLIAIFTRLLTSTISFKKS